MLTEDWLLTRMMFLIPLILSLTVHEWAHAWSAWKLGDDTARRQGRLSLNPLVHMDPVGSLLLPLLGVPFGWAKPVPVNIGRFDRSVSLRSGVFLVAGAGPISNLCIAIFSAVALVVSAMLFGGVAAVPEALHVFLDTLIFLNVLLAVFNLLPVPPLDGSRIVDCMMPEAFRGVWDGFCRLGYGGLIVVLLLIAVLGGDMLMWPIQVTQESIDALVQQFAG